MKENFLDRMNAMKMVIRINNPEKYQELQEKSSFWAPEAAPLNYTKWVQSNYDINPDDYVSLNVYSILMDVPLEKLREKIIQDLNSKNNSKETEYVGKHLK